MTDFISPESVKDLIPILLKDEEIENINSLIKQMVIDNKKNCKLISILEHESAKIKSVIERLCKLGWRVYGEEGEPDSVVIIKIDNPYYKSNDNWVNELEDHFKH